MTKFLVFTDLHSEIIDNYESRIYEIIGAAHSNKVDAIINIGDLGYHGNTGVSICPMESQPVNYKYFNEQQTSKYVAVSYTHLTLPTKA